MNKVSAKIYEYKLKRQMKSFEKINDEFGNLQAEWEGYKKAVEFRLGLLNRNEYSESLKIEKLYSNYCINQLGLNANIDGFKNLSRTIINYGVAKYKSHYVKNIIKENSDYIKRMRKSVKNSSIKYKNLTKKGKIDEEFRSNYNTIGYITSPTYFKPQGRLTKNELKKQLKIQQKSFEQISEVLENVLQELGLKENNDAKRKITNELFFAGYDINARKNALKINMKNTSYYDEEAIKENTRVLEALSNQVNRCAEECRKLPIARSELLPLSHSVPNEKLGQRQQYSQQYQQQRNSYLDNSEGPYRPLISNQNRWGDHMFQQPNLPGQRP